jgi:pectin-derived oligosaccharide transport system permease protein
MTVATSTRSAPKAGRGGRAVLTRRQQAYRRLLIHCFLILAAFVMVYPVLWLLGQSFQPDQKIFSGQIVPTGDFTYRNYVDGWGALQFGTFTRFFINSAVITALAVLGNLMSCSLAAYALARLRFPGRRIFFALTIGTLMLPYHVLIIPQYVLFSQLGWVNTITPLVLPKFLATDAFYVFLMVQFIRTLPEELTESAKLDGCGHLRIFARIILPLSLPALGTTAVFTFIHTWNDFLTPLIYLASPEHYTVPLALQMFVDASGGQSSYGSLFAMSILSLGPVIGFFIAFQRTLVQGIATTGLK